MPTDRPAATRYEHPLLPRSLQEDYRRLGYWEGLTLADIVADWAGRDPGRVAVVGPTKLSYGELWSLASRVAGRLQRDGLRVGDALLAVLPNSWQGIVLEIAASIAGAVLVPRSPHISTALALNLCEQLDVRGLVVDGDLLAQPEWQQLLQTLRPRLEGKPIMLQGDVGDAAADDQLSLLEDAAASGPVADRVDADPSAPCLVLATGGTTGTPKSILHSSESLIYAVRHFGFATEFSEADTHVAFAPYGHAGGSVFDVYFPLLHGASVLPLARWRVDDAAEAIARWRGTFMVTMGTHLFDLLGLDGAAEKLSSMRLALSGAAPDALFSDAEHNLRVPIARVYGCGECPGHAIGRIADPPEVRLHRDGVPFAGIEVRIVDLATGEPVAEGTPGEYQCRGPNLFMGYAGQPELTAQAVTEDGFYRSGDVMVASSDGYVTWNGRTKDIIRRGGLQIDPVEMENLLAKHRSVSSVVVVGQPDLRLGEIAVVVMVPEPGEDEPGLRQLCDYLLEQGLPRQSLPERLVLTDALPKTEVGKFHRVEIARRLGELAPDVDRLDVAPSR